MKFEDRGNEKRIIFETGDSLEEMRMVEQQLAFLRNLFSLIKRKAETK